MSRSPPPRHPEEENGDHRREDDGGERRRERSRHAEDDYRERDRGDDRRHRERDRGGERERERERDRDRGSRRHRYDDDEGRHRSRDRRSRSRSRDRDRSSKRASGFDLAPPGAASATPAAPGAAAAAAPGLFPFGGFGAFPQIPVQATRHARRVYVGGLPPMANEQSVATFFSQALAAVGGNSAGPGDAVVNVYINQEKKFAFVECRTVEEASNAMALDGINYEGMRSLSVYINYAKKFAFLELRTGTEASNAMALDGINLEGVSVRVRRPSDYNPSAAAALGPSHPNPNLQLQNVGLTPGAAGGADGPDRVFVGGLPYYLSEEQIKELLSSFGPLRAFDLVKDRDTGNSKGYGFCVYQDPAVVDVACAALNGMRMGDKTLTVRRATASGQPKPDQAQILQQAQQQIALQVGALLPPHMLGMAGTGANTMPLGGGLGGPAENPTNVISLLSVVSPNELQDDNEYNDIMEDMREECSKYGSLVRVVIPRPDPSGQPVAGVGRVFVEYGDTGSSARAKQSLHGRKFGGNAVVATYYPEDKFAQGDLSASV